MGVAAWIDAQLEPRRLDDRATDRALERYRVLNQSPAELLGLFQDNQRANRERQAMGDSGMMRPAPGDRPVTGIRRANLELQQATVARAILSERQLYEVLVDVWTNHFNVFLGKGPNRALVADYIATAIRPNAVGRFEDLLLAAARHPAMLIYLDNAQSVTEGAEPPRPPGRRGQRPLPRQMPSGINENYARELLELHTVGVDAGYTQDDVVAVARILTGWSLDPRGRTRFQFHAWAHDRDAKVVMGRAFPAGRGEDEGIALLRWLANHPSTMRHVSARLCARFVADDPPDGCVDAGVRAWERSNGQITDVVRAILMSPEFWAPEHRASKIKSPFEFVVSAARALGAVPDTSLALPQMLQRLGQPLYLYSPPTGYPERMESWVSSSALFDRFNLAVALASGRAPGLTVNLTSLGNLESIAQQVLPGGMSAATRAAITQETAGLEPAQARVLMVGLALGSPEFQRQ